MTSIKESSMYRQIAAQMQEGNIVLVWLHFVRVLQICSHQQRCW